MYHFIFLIIILICFVVIGYLFFTKMFSLVNLDIQNLPKEIEQKRKKEIIIKRLEAQGREFGRKVLFFLSPLKNIWFFLQKKFRFLVIQTKKLWHHEEAVNNKLMTKEITPEKTEKKLNTIIKEAENFFTTQNYDKAEELYIAALRLSPKSIPIYRGLADTYFAKKAYNEAAETYEFLLNLDKKDISVLTKLAEIKEIQNKLDEAINYYHQATIIGDSSPAQFFHLAELLLKVNQPDVALEAIKEACLLEPKNPKYLDLLIETAIICGDKLLAEKSFEELRLVNPDNNKLIDFRERINKL